MKNLKLFEEFKRSLKNDNQPLIDEISSLIKRYYSELLSNNVKYPTESQLKMLASAKATNISIMKRKWLDKVHEIEEAHKQHSPESV